MRQYWNVQNPIFYLYLSNVQFRIQFQNFTLRIRSVANQTTNMPTIFRKLWEGIRKLIDNKQEGIPARSLEMRNMKKPRSVRKAIRIVQMTQSETQKKRELYSLGCNKSEPSINFYTSNKT